MSARRSSGARPSCVYGTEKSGLGQGGHERKQRGAERHGRLSGELAGQVPRGEHDGAPARHAVCDAAGLGIVDVDRIVDMGLFGGELDRTLDITAHVADDPQERRGGSVVEPAYRRLRHQARVRLVQEHAVEEHGQARQPAVEHALVQLRMPQVLAQLEGRRGVAPRDHIVLGEHDLVHGAASDGAREQAVEVGRRHRDGVERVYDFLSAERDVVTAPPQ